jgi:hypothetical protein
MMPLAEVLLEPDSIRRLDGRDWQVIAFQHGALIAVPADTPTVLIHEERDR